MLSDKHIRRLRAGDEADALVARLATGYRYYGNFGGPMDAILDDPVAHREQWEAEYQRLPDGSFFARSPERNNRFTQKVYDAHLLATRYGVVTFEYVAGKLPPWFPRGDRFLSVVYGKGYSRTDATGPTEALAICRAVLLGIVRRQRRSG